MGDQPLAESYRKDGHGGPPRDGAALDILLFGPGELRLLGANARRGSTQPKAFALLVRLALSRDAFVRRDTLLALLWPDLDGTRGRNALSQAMHRLRRDLGADILVARGQEEVGLAPSANCDVRSFRESIRLGRLPEALAAYRGTLLEGFHLARAGPFQQWLDGERDEARQVASRAALALADREERAGRTRSMAGWLRRAVEISPADETSLERLIRTLRDTGDRAGAVRAYEFAAARLWVELEMEPSHEIRALVEGLRGTPRPIDPDARRAFLRGRFLGGMLGQAEAALASYRRALELDPDYAAANAGLAECLASIAIQGHLRRDQAAAALEASARKAIDLDPGLAEAHVALGVGKLVFSRDWAGAERALRRAVELEPWSPRAHGHLSFFLSTMGWHEEAVARASRAEDLDPLDPLMSFLGGFALYRARRYGDALVQLRALVDLHPHHALAHMFIAETELKLVHHAEAIAGARRAWSLLPDDPLLTGICACVLGYAGEREEARALIDHLGTLGRTRYVNPHFLASAHAGLGENDVALELWSTMVDQDEPGAFLLRTDPLFDPMSPDDRFREILDRLALPEVPGVDP